MRDTCIKSSPNKLNVCVTIFAELDIVAGAMFAGQFTSKGVAGGLVSRTNSDKIESGESPTSSSFVKLRNQIDWHRAA